MLPSAVLMRLAPAADTEAAELHDLPWVHGVYRLPGPRKMGG
jgi:hypothetical protein